MERVYIRSIPLNVRCFGGGENHPERMARSPWFWGVDYKGALFDLGVSQSHFSSQIMILIHILTCSKISPQKLVFAFHSGFYLRVLSVNSVNSVPDVSQSNGKIKSDTGR